MADLIVTFRRASGGHGGVTVPLASSHGRTEVITVGGASDAGAGLLEAEVGENVVSLYCTEGCWAVVGRAPVYSANTGDNRTLVPPATLVEFGCSSGDTVVAVEL